MTRLFALLFGLIPVLGFCQDTKLDQLRQQFSQDSHGVFDYSETRQLELADTPWQGQGIMLTAADGTLVKLQLQPERIIMAIAGDTLYYWQPSQNQLHSMPVSVGADAAQQILIFRRILQGRFAELQQEYDLTADVAAQHWSIRLQPKQPDEQAIVEISVSGDKSSRHILIKQKDGDSTEYRISKADPQTAARYSIPALLQEAGGE